MRLSEISDYEDQNQNLSWMEVLWKIIWILFERHNKRGYCLKQNSMCCCRAHLNITPCWRRTHLNIWQSSFLSKETIHGTDDWQDPCLWHEKRLVRSKVFNFLGPFGRFVSNFFQADFFSSLWSKYSEMRKFLEWRGRACCLRWKEYFPKLKLIENCSKEIRLLCCLEEQSGPKDVFKRSAKCFYGRGLNGQIYWVRAATKLLWEK